MPNYERKFVQVTPIYGKSGLKCFKSNIKPGDELIYMRSSGPIAQYLPRKVVVVSESPFHFMVDRGKYQLSVNKASVYCRDEILYFEEKNDAE